MSLQNHNAREVLLSIQKTKELLEELPLNRRGLKQKKHFQRLYTRIVTHAEELEADLDYEELRKIKNTVAGVFEGLTDRPVPRPYLRKVLKDIRIKLGSLEEEWNTISNSLVTPKQKKESKLAGGLSLKDQLSVWQKENEKKEEVTSTIDASDDIANWGEDEAVLKEFCEAKPKYNLTKQFALTELPIMLGYGYNQKIVNKFKEKGYDAHRVFGMYTVIKNMTVFGVRDETYDEYKREGKEYLLLKKIYKDTEHQFHVISNAEPLGNYYFYLLLKKGIFPVDYTLEQWCFNVRNRDLVGPNHLWR